MFALMPDSNPVFLHLHRAGTLFHLVLTEPRPKIQCKSGFTIHAQFTVYISIVLGKGEKLLPVGCPCVRSIQVL